LIDFGLFLSFPSFCKCTTIQLSSAQHFLLKAKLDSCALSAPTTQFSPASHTLGQPANIS
jgi:hypothetical protein